MKRSLLAVLTSILLTSLSGYGRHAAQADRAIHFIFPDGYVGAFRLILDKRDGVDLKLENGRYGLESPKSGTLKVKSFKPFAE